MTLAPIDRRLIVTSMITAQERAWLDAYHARVRDTLSGHLDAAHPGMDQRRHRAV